MSTVQRVLNSYVCPSGSLSPGAELLYQGGLREQRHETNRIFSWLMPAQWLFAILLSVWISPGAWEGVLGKTQSHFWVALGGGALLVSGPLLFIRLRPNAAFTPHVVAISQMLFSALLVYLTHGRIETHFHIFGSLAILAFYLDRSVLFTASAVVVTDHFLRGFMFPQSVYGVAAADWWRTLEHGAWIAFEVTFLVYFAERTGRRTLRFAAETSATQEALTQGEQRLRLVIETAYDAYVALNADGKVVGWNKQAQRTFGWNLGEVLGESLVEKIIPERPREAHHRDLQQLLRTETDAV